MAVSGWGPDPPLELQLYDEGFRFEFFQAVRVLNRLQPTRQEVGGDRPDHEIVRFHSYISLAFPASEVYDVRRGKSPTEPPQMWVSFMGLVGPSAALPRYYTELILQRARQKDFALRDFLDLFNHRLISLFYRAWEKYHAVIGYERAEAAERQAIEHGAQALHAFITSRRPRIDRVSQCLLDLSGTGAPALRYSAADQYELRPRRAVADETLRFYAGLLAQRHRSALGLETMLCDYFDVPIAVRQFCGQWLKLEPENQSCFTAGGIGGNMRLGHDTVVGERVWDAQGKFRVRVGPLVYRQFHDFLPSGSAYRPLEHLTRLYAGAQYDFDVQLVLVAAEVPPCQLSADNERCVRLGWDSWLASRPTAHDASDAVFVGSDA